MTFPATRSGRQSDYNNSGGVDDGDGDGDGDSCDVTADGRSERVGLRSWDCAR